MRLVTLRTGLTAVVGLSVVALPVLEAPFASAAATCQGQPVTIAATAGTVTGTDGPDVISVEASPPYGVEVDARGGDDLICVQAFNVTLDAGAGNDSVVDESADYLFLNQITVSLGPGDDRFVELGDIRDRIDYPAFGGDPSGTDVISTGPNIDYVGSGVPGEPNRDVIAMGDGARTLTLVLPPGSSMSATSAFPSTVDHVSGRSRAVTLTAPRRDTARWTIDAAGPVTRDGVQVADLRGFGGSYDARLGRRSEVRFVGHEEADAVTLTAGTVEADLGGGSDLLILGSQEWLPRRVRLQGGAYPDRIEVDNVGGRVQLGRSARLRLDDRKIGRARGFEEVVAVAQRIELVGSSGDDSLLAMGCSVHLTGGRGDDDLRRPTFGERSAFQHCRDNARYFIHGEAGDDTMTGYRGDDVLTGGPGRDRADGGPGRDVCEAERTRSC